MLKINGFDHCIIGISQILGKDDFIVVYDTMEIVSTLQERDGMSEEEAIEYFDYNIHGAYLGDYTPMFVTRCGINKVDEWADLTYCDNITH